MHVSNVHWRSAALLLALASIGPHAGAQTSPAAAAAAAGPTSTSANGGTGGVGLGGVGRGVAAAGQDGQGGVGTTGTGRAPGNGALVGPRAKKEARELLAAQPDGQVVPPANSGQRAVMLDRDQRGPAVPSK